ncbi:hypothetical protein [Candidatus Palauibacter sp.]|uniref:hypothetical protein n=1 Tax=Candidatus Palauibacter sp. TaxID=3101350 RepID=UPI003C7035F5
MIRSKPRGVLAICFVLSLPGLEACGALFDPSHGSITGTWVGSVSGESAEPWTFPLRWTLRVTESADGAVTGTIMRIVYIDPLPPLDFVPPPPWIVDGSHRGSTVKLTFAAGGTVKQYFEGKHVDQNVIEGFLSLEEDAEQRAPVEFLRRPAVPPAEGG